MIKKTFLFSLLMGLYSIAAAQQSAADSFWLKIGQHCGKLYEGQITDGGKEGDGFTGKKLIMEVRVCEEGVIKIPFYVGDDKSRVWVLTSQEGRIQLKHDHTHEDGTPDKVTRYGGLASNTGNSMQQVFPADQETCDLLPAACGNVWWMTINDTAFTYNLRRIGSDRFFSVSFDLTKPIAASLKPWGWK